MLCMAGVLILACGCSPEPVRIEAAPRVLLVDKPLSSQMEIVRQVPDRVDGNLMRIRTQMRNLTKNSLWIDIQVVWKDKDGFELYKTNWTAKHLPPGLAEDHDIVSMRSDAADYEFRIRRPVKAKG